VTNDDQTSTPPFLNLMGQLVQLITAHTFASTTVSVAPEVGQFGEKVVRFMAERPGGAVLPAASAKLLDLIRTLPGRVLRIRVISDGLPTNDGVVAGGAGQFRIFRLVRDAAGLALVQMAGADAEVQLTRLRLSGARLDTTEAVGHPKRGLFISGPFY